MFRCDLVVQMGIDAMKVSHLELDYIREKTRVTRMVSRVPLRLLETGQHQHAVEIQLSSYGGGILQGDRVALNIRCGDRTGLRLKSQANTHVYRNDIQQEAIQRLSADCGERTVIEVIPEPVVLHAGADFRQEQAWNISESTDFVLADWMQSGRSESNEQFAFKRFESRVLIALDDQPVLEENFICRPEMDDIRSPALFGPYDLMLNIYMLGPRAEERCRKLKPFLDFPQFHSDVLPRKGGFRLPSVLCALNPLPNASGYIFRAMAETRRQLQPVVNMLTQT